MPQVRHAWPVASSAVRAPWSMPTTTCGGEPIGEVVGPQCFLVQCPHPYRAVTPAAAVYGLPVASVGSCDMRRRSAAEVASWTSGRQRPKGTPRSWPSSYAPLARRHDRRPPTRDGLRDRRQERIRGAHSSPVRRERLEGRRSRSATGCRGRRRSSGAPSDLEFAQHRPEQCLKPVDVDVREGRTFPVIE